MISASMPTAEGLFQTYSFGEFTEVVCSDVEISKMRALGKAVWNVK
jgi:hypothetical protein